MRFGLTHANLAEFVDGDAARRLARAAESSGFDSIWTVDHLALPVEYQPLYPETADGRLPNPVTTPLADPLVWLSNVASEAPTLLLGTAVLLLPLRHPLLTAKMAASLDAISHGRLRLGVGIGWMREEYEAAGVTFEQRGKLLDESVEILRALWTGQPTRFDGRFHRFAEVVSQPAPPVPIPIHIGGYSPAAARRAGRKGDGFFPGGNDPARLGPLLEEMRRAAEAAGRDPAAIEVTTRGTDDLDHLRELERLGVHRVTVSIRSFDEPDRIAGLRDYHERVIAPHQRAHGGGWS